MKKQWIVLITLLAVMLLAGCQAETAIPADSLQDTEIETTSSFSGSKTETTESESESSEKTEQSEVSVTEEPPIAETSAIKKETPDSNPTPTESKNTVTTPEKKDDTGITPSEAPQTEPEPTPEPATPAETVSESKPEITVTPKPTKELEPTPPPTPEPKSIYDYEFDVEAIKQELVAVGTGMGLTHTGDMTPDAASWSNPVTASQSFQGSGLERSVKDYVRSMPDIITMYGGTTIQYFTIYVEPLGGGSYRFYFLY